MLSSLRKLVLLVLLIAMALVLTRPAEASGANCYSSLTLTLSCPAVRVADSMWDVGQRNRTEVALCATVWDTANGVAHIERLDPSRNILKQDSLHVYYDKTICDDSLPNMHTHFLHVISKDGTDWRHIPSPADSEAFKNRWAPFYVLMSDKGTYRVYDALR